MSTTDALPVVAFVFDNGFRGRMALPLESALWQRLPHGTKLCTVESARAALAAQAEKHAADLLKWKTAWEEMLQLARDKEIKNAALRAERDALKAALLAFRQAGIELGWGAHPKWYPLIQQCDAAIEAGARTGGKG